MVRVTKFVLFGVFSICALTMVYRASRLPGFGSQRPWLTEAAHTNEAATSKARFRAQTRALPAPTPPKPLTQTTEPPTPAPSTPAPPTPALSTPAPPTPAPPTPEPPTPTHAPTTHMTHASSANRDAGDCKAADRRASLSCVKRALMYWKQPRLKPKQVSLVFPRSAKRKYITMEIDFGGFNNVRQGIEVVLGAALLTGRTLVLPPARGWYLINWGPKKRDQSGSDNSGATSSISDFFDVNDLKKYIDVITTEEFFNRERQRFGIPARFTAQNIAHGNSPDLQPFDKWWRAQNKHVAVMAEWNPMASVIMWPSKAAVKASNALRRLPQNGQAFLAGRREQEYTRAQKEADVLLFPMDYTKGWRFLGQIASWALFAQQAQDKVFKGFFRDGVHYVPEVYEVAAQIVAKLGGFGAFSSAHVRRNDLQYKEVFISGDKTAQHVTNLLKPGESLYIATDELAPGFFKALSQGRKVYRWHDFVKPKGLIEPRAVSYRIGGLIEQVICAAGRVFIGTPQSTFTGFIPRLRGYMDAADKNTYFHTEMNVKLKMYAPWDTTPNFMRESSTMWEDAR